MPSVREWHNLKPIEQSLARCIERPGTLQMMEAMVDSLSRDLDIAVKRSPDGGWLIYQIPTWASST